MSNCSIHVHQSPREREQRQPRQPRESYRNGREDREEQEATVASAAIVTDLLQQSKDDSGEVRRLRRKVERLISVLVEKGVLTPDEIDAVDNGFAAAHAAQQPAIEVADYDEDDEDDQ